jgi:hypothetical protein
MRDVKVPCTFRQIPVDRTQRVEVTTGTQIGGARQAPMKRLFFC